MNKDSIVLSETEALKVIVDLDQIVVSLDQIKSHFATDIATEERDKALSNFMIDQKVSQTYGYHLRTELTNGFSTSPMGRIFRS